jgi:hypothetical protein
MDDRRSRLKYSTLLSGDGTHIDAEGNYRRQRQSPNAQAVIPNEIRRSADKLDFYARAFLR